MTINPKNIFAEEPGYDEYINGEISFEEFLAMIDATSPSVPSSPEDEAYYWELSNYYSSPEGQEKILEAITQSSQQEQSKAGEESL